MAVTKYEIMGIYSLLNVSPTILVISVKNKFSRGVFEPLMT